jgi:hypothetical protein
VKREPVTIRASSFGSLFDCPARWIAIHLEGKRTPSSANSALGTGVHAGTAVYDESRVDSLLLTDLDIVLTGHTDRVRRTDDGLGICDLKTGKTAVGTDGTAKTHGHAAQMGVYEIVAETALGARMDLPAQIIGLQTNLTPDKQRIGTGEIEGAREVLIGNEEHTGLLRVAAQLVHGDIAPWGNPKSMMCHKRYCPNYQTCFWRR